MVVTVTLNPCIDRTIKLKSFLYGSMNRMAESKRDVSGKGINVSLALNNLGIENKALGFIFSSSKDCFLSSLENLGLKYKGIEVSGELRENIKIWNEADKTTTEINQKGSKVEEKDWALFKDLYRKEIDSAALIVLSGSMPAGLSIDAYKELIEIANERDIKVILDAEGDALLKGLEAGPLLIKPNQYEFEKTFKTGSIRENAHKLILENRAENVVVSLGKGGAFIYSSKGSYLAPPVEVDAKSAQGAGDNMVAGIIKAYLENKGPDEMLAYGTAAALGSLEVEGTGPTTYDLFASYLDKTKVLRI